MTVKVLGQSAPTAATLTTLYTVPSSKESVVSSLVVCNRGAKTTFRIAVRPAGAAISNEHYLAYDHDALGNSTTTFVIGMTLATTDVVSVYNTLATCSFTLFGSEDSV